MKIAFFGTPQFAVPSLTHLLGHPDFEVVAVVTQPDKRRGRGGKVTPSPVKAAALEAGCAIWQPTRIKRDAETLNRLKSIGADAFVVVAYGQILSQSILDMPRLGCINAHGSLLPAYRGAAPIQWCLHNGERETGITTMLMNAGMDTGPMLLKATVSISPTENAWQLAHRLSTLSADLLVSTLQKLDQQQIRPVLQDNSHATYAPLIKKEDYCLDWSASAKAIHDKVRGFYPNCTTQFRENTLKVTETVPLGFDYWSDYWSESSSGLSSELSTVRSLYEFTKIEQNGEPGTVVGILKNYGPIVQTGTGHLLLLSVKPAGKRVLSGWDFANGSRIEIGEVLDSL